MKKYEIGVNNLYEDRWNCVNCDHQYTAKVEAENEEEAKIKAIEYVKNNLKDLLVSDWLEIAWIQEVQNEINR